MTIDWWTLGIQTINVLILVWLLGHFFWRPVAAMIEQRRTTAQIGLAEAEAKRAAATAALAQIERTRAGFAQERDAILKAAQDTAEHMRTALLNQAAKEAAVFEATAKAAIAKERDAAEQAWVTRASRLAVDIAKRLAARLDGPAVQTVFLDWLLKEIRGLPDAVRQTMAAQAGLLEAVSATPLEPADQEHYRKLIADAFGDSPQITFTTDPALIVGLELRSSHLVITNSWRADLARILADLGHDNRD